MSRLNKVGGLQAAEQISLLLRLLIQTLILLSSDPVTQISWSVGLKAAQLTHSSCSSLANSAPCLLYITWLFTYGGCGNEEEWALKCFNNK